MSKIREFLAKQSDEELEMFLQDTVILTDDLSLELIKRVGSPHSPLAVTDLPIPKYSEDATLARLYELEGLGVLTSKLKKKGQD